MAGLRARAASVAGAREDGVRVTKSGVEMMSDKFLEVLEL